MRCQEFRLKRFHLVLACATVLAGNGNGAWARSRAQELSARAMAESCVKDTQDLALKHIDEALAFDRSNASFWLAKAVILEKRGESEKALPCVIRAIELSNQYDYAYAVEANILTSLHRFDAALKAIDHALQLKPCKENFVGRAEIFIAQGKLDMAEKELDKIIKTNPKYDLARVRRAVVARRAQHWPKAIEDLTWLVDQAPVKNLSYYEDLLCRAQAYIETKQYDKAIADCKVGLAGQPEARQFHATLLKIYERSGNAAEAKRARKELEAVDDDLQPPKSDRF